MEVIGYYEKRWLIEEWHKALKTGCQVEGRQLHTSGRLEALTGVLSVVAVQLCDALSFSVTGSPEIGAPVFALVSTADTVVAVLYSPVAALTLRVVGMAGGALTFTLEDALEER